MMIPKWKFLYVPLFGDPGDSDPFDSSGFLGGFSDIFVGFLDFFLRLAELRADLRNSAAVESVRLLLADPELSGFSPSSSLDVDLAVSKERYISQ